MAASQRVLFVCAGNVCRSPMAEAFMRQLIRERPGLTHVEVLSAGVIAGEGDPPFEQTIRVMSVDHGIDLAAHRARRFSPDLQADLVLTLDRRVTDAVRRAGASGDVHLIGDFAGSPGEAVDDPFGGSIEDHRACAVTIKRLVEGVASRLERQASGPDAAS